MTCPPSCDACIHSSRDCPHISTGLPSWGAGSEPMRRKRDPSFAATALELALSSAMVWITSRQPRWSNAHWVAAVAPSGAKPLPQCSRTMLQPTSVPGQPSGSQGPSLPTHCPLALSMTEKKPKRCHSHTPIIAANVRQATDRGCTPPICRAASSSAMNAAHGSKSCGLRRTQDQAFGFELQVEDAHGFSLFPSPIARRCRKGG